MIARNNSNLGISTKYYANMQWRNLRTIHTMGWILETRNADIIKKIIILSKLLLICFYNCAFASYRAFVIDKLSICQRTIHCRNLMVQSAKLAFLSNKSWRGKNWKTILKNFVIKTKIPKKTKCVTNLCFLLNNVGGTKKVMKHNSSRPREGHQVSLCFRTAC